ncbi:PHP domain-containing protein [Massilia sp. YMA4]|uniref:PHP domain-containing protein n=1 Tax=Massilia sp. YMA4 TaxID=1593482 RepID=UPI000DD185D9|nr:PHP domain-containing protein [Massilia sp. YMA4]AXA89700.1 hypothetical protein DPH57_00005 [Massilia sp. YMA4]
MKVDLHCHSNVSDGVLPPALVAAHARQGGVDVWALTDHDEVGGTAAARAAAREQGMRFVAGVEISITWGGETVHIVGLQIDEDDPALVQGLAATRSGRDARGRETLQQGVLFDEFKQLGGAAIEVVTGSHTPDQYPVYAQLANAYGFLASRGTDFHAPGEARVDFAALPPLPGNVTPVWHDWF